MTADVLRMAFLDDRPDMQESVINGLSPFIPEGWELIPCPLKQRISDYVPWLHQNNVVVLLTDQMLDEKATKGTAVNYKGHNVIQTIRESIPQFPIVVATRATADPDLRNHFGEADDVVDRETLVREGEFRVQRYTRLGERFLATYQDELSELAKLSEKAATTKLTKAERTRIEAIQSKLSIEVPVEGPLDDVIDQMTKGLQSLDELSQKAAELLSDVEKQAKSNNATGKKKK